MKKSILLLLIIPLISMAQSQNDSVFVESLAFQKRINSEYATPEESPLTANDFEAFKGLPFFDIDRSYFVVARLEIAKRKKTIRFKTSTDRRPAYDIYGKVFFTIKGTEYSLNIYQSHSLRDNEEFSHYLFLPFMDLTNGKTSYAGGRYIDLSIPESDTILLNFNMAYNPYCAYSTRYSCPVVPEENFINIEINAGVMAPENH